MSACHTRPGWGWRVAPSVIGRARLSVCVCVCVCDLCVCVGDRLGVGAGDGLGRGLRSLSAWPAASGLGWLSAPPRSGWVSGRPCGFPGCVAQRLGAGCGARSIFRSVLAALVFSPPSLRVYHPGRLRVCLRVGGDPWGRGGHCHTCPGGGGGGDGGTVSGSPPQGLTWEQMARTQGRDRESRAAATPNLPGEGLLLAAPLFVVWGSAPPPLFPPRARSVRLGVGMSQRRPPPASHGNLGGEDAASSPRSGTRRTPGGAEG